MPKKSIEQEIEEFVELLDCDHLIQFIADFMPLYELLNVDEAEDWLRDAVGEADTQNVRLVQIVYLMSKLAENHSGRLCRLNYQFKGLWKRMEKERNNA